jgi:hypothetical protein
VQPSAHTSTAGVMLQLDGTSKSSGARYVAVEWAWAHAASVRGQRGQQPAESV